MALILEKEDFQHILRILNTNVAGRDKIMYALTKIKGVGRRLSNLACKKAEIDLNKRAGELSEDEIDKIRAVLANPMEFDVPSWFVNRTKDRLTGKDLHLVCNHLDAKLREDLERLKKIRAHRGYRHYWRLKVRGQHTKTTGRRGRTVGVAGKK